MKMVRKNIHIPEQSLYKIVAYQYNVNQEQDYYFHGRSSTIHTPEKYENQYLSVTPKLSVQACVHWSAGRLQVKILVYTSSSSSIYCVFKQ